MSTEIADSDGESELASPAQSNLPPQQHPAETLKRAATDDIGLRSSNLLSQEQEVQEEWRLKSLSAQQTATQGRFAHEGVVTGVADGPAREEQISEHAVTASHGGAFQPELAAMELMETSSRKRRHTMQGDGEDAGGSDQLSQKRQRKSRAKTYGHKTDRMRSSQTQASNDAFEDLIQASQLDGGPGDTAGHLSSAPATVNAGLVLNPIMSMKPPRTVDSRAIEEEDESPHQGNRSRRVSTLVEGSMSDTSREISTSRSSIGNYESINMDFRGCATGLKAGTNPFGSLSQTSVEDEVDDPFGEKLVSERNLTSPNTDAFLPTSATDPPGIGHDLGRWNRDQAANGDESHQTTGRSRSIDPMLLYNDHPGHIRFSFSKDSSNMKSQASTTRPPMSPVADTNVMSINRSMSDLGGDRAQTTIKKRGRKPKSQRLQSQSPEPAQEEEPNLKSDELAIGLPKEQYKPRPSRSRAPEPTTKEKTRQVDEQNRPIDQPTSELNLSDEAFVGLPKENYKPRPSRSRSKRITPEDEDPTLPESRPAADQAPVSSSAVLDEADCTPAKKPKRPKKPPKKTKVKRAQTSAGALLKKSEPMLSEGEEDVLWLETKPSQVKLDPPREIKREKAPGGKHPGLASADSSLPKAAAGKVGSNLENKEEERHEPPTSAASKGVREAKTPLVSVDTRKDSGTTTDTRHILVDVPPLSTSHISVEPKKRGRKKKASEAPAVESPDFEEPNNGSEASDVEVSGVAEDGGASAPLANPEPKKRGRKKKVADVPAETEEDNETAEQGRDASPSEEDTHRSRRPALVEKDLNRPTPPANLKTTKDGVPDLANEKPSLVNENQAGSAVSHLETPHKQVSIDANSTKGPTKHSPINPSGGKVSYRVGLSKRAAIPSLLKIVRKDIGRPKEKEKPKRRLEHHVPVEDED